jgi:pimeloyl-ACP methyl ester carboxylesterase
MAPLVEPALEQIATVTTYDRRGVGRSDPVAGKPTVADMADDLRDLLVALDVPGPVTLVGLSLGGLLSAYFACTYPGLVNALVLIDPTCHDDPELFPKGWGLRLALARVLSHIGPLRRPLLERKAAAMLTSSISDEARAALNEMLADSRVLQWNALELARLRESCALTADAVAAHSPSGIPVIVISADHHEVSGGSADLHERVLASHRRLADAWGGRTVVAAGSGHVIPLERPDVVIDAVRETLSLLAAG